MEVNGKAYWVAAGVYAAAVATRLEGFWMVLNFILIAVTARHGFVALYDLFKMARNPDIMEQAQQGNKTARQLLITLGLAAVLYTVAIPLGTPLPAYLASLVAWAGLMVILAPAAINKKQARQTEREGEKDAA